MQNLKIKSSVVLPLIFSGMLLAFPVRAIDDSAFVEVRALASSGAALLAQHTIDTLQPAAKSDPEGWMAWERERVRIYQQSADWSSLVNRLETLPPNLPADFAPLGNYSTC